MKTATVRELRNDFQRISRLLAKGETVQILKRGKRVAKLVPDFDEKQPSLLNATPSLFPLPPDIDEPVDAEWDALK